MLNEEFLNDLLGKDDVSADDKVKQIIAEAEADTRGLLQKRDELLGSEKKLKEQISAFGAEKEGYEKRISELDEALKKASSKDNREYYETQISDLNKKYSAEIEDITEQRNYYKQMHLNSLRDKAIEAGLKDLNFVDGLKDGFVARVLSMNEFEPKDINGELKFLNKDNHTIDEVIKSFALTTEGKAYIRNSSTGGGARGSSTEHLGGGKTMTRDQFNELQARDPNKASQFFREGGRIV